MDLSEIPLIDLAPLLAQEPDLKQVADVRKACSNVGFFQPRPAQPLKPALVVFEIAHDWLPLALAGYDAGTKSGVSAPGRMG